jgi:hypothetical protein
LISLNGHEHGMGMGKLASGVDRVDQVYTTKVLSFLLHVGPQRFRVLYYTGRVWRL